MGLFRLLKQLWRATAKKPRGWRPGRLALESLETRTVPSVVAISAMSSFDGTTDQSSNDMAVTGSVQGVSAADAAAGNFVVRVYAVTNDDYIQPFTNSPPHAIDPTTMTYHSATHPFDRLRADLVDTRSNQVVAVDTFLPSSRPHSGTTPNDRLPALLYPAVLGRLPDSTGMTYYRNQAEAGVSRHDLGLEFWQSAEGRAQQVVDYYQAILGRFPDSAGLAYWIHQFQAGASEFDVERGILGSPEYLNANGQNPTDFVNSLYARVLLRPADDPGRNYWVNQLQNGGLTPDQVALRFLTSQENETRVIQGLYEELLGRPATGGDVPYWLGVFQGGASPTQVAGLFLATDEFLTDALGLSYQIHFGNQTWQLKDFDNVGPGPSPQLNNFLAGNVFVDRHGNLHLLVNQQTINNQTHWYCAEVVGQALGYGTYTWVISGNLPNLDPQAVAGLFVFGPTGSGPQREFDFELWNRTTTNAQFVVQPSTTSGNLLPFSTTGNTLTVSLNWTAGSLVATAWAGVVTPGQTPIQTWHYTGNDLPATAADLLVHMNLWLRNQPPDSGQNQEVVINAFQFTP